MAAYFVEHKDYWQKKDKDTTSLQRFYIGIDSWRYRDAKYLIILCKIIIPLAFSNISPTKKPAAIAGLSRSTRLHRLYHYFPITVFKNCSSLSTQATACTLAAGLRMVKGLADT